MIPAWLDQPVWRPITAPLTNGTTDRNPQHLLRLVEQFRVETAPRYARDGSKTRCNLFVADVTAALGCPVPLLWLVGDKWTEQNANALHAWLKGPATNHGWERSDAHTAQRMADEGQVAIASWANPIPAEPGHLALLKPSFGQPGVWTAQAGAVNFTHDHIQRGFGAIAPDYFVHP